MFILFEAPARSANHTFPYTVRARSTRMLRARPLPTKRGKAARPHSSTCQPPPVEIDENDANPENLREAEDGETTLRPYF